MRQARLEFTVASAASQGARSYQEDSTRVWSTQSPVSHDDATDNLLAVLADGMGGHVSGEVASRLVCDASVKHFAAQSGRTETKLQDALHAANETLARAIRESGKLAGMGCTAIIAHADCDGLHWVSVGDSSLLLLRNDELYRLNENHSLGAILDKQAAANLITYEEARNSPNRHSLRSALTGGQIALADIGRYPQGLLPGDWVIAASDGLDTLTGDEIASIIHRHATRSPAEVAQRLLDEVGKRNLPGQDNTSIIAIRACAASDITAPAAAQLTRPANGAGNGRVAGPASDEPDTEVPLAPIRGTLIGQARSDEPVAATVLLRHHDRARGRSPFVVAIITACVVALAAGAVAALQPQLLATVLTSILGGADEKPAEPGVPATRAEPAGQVEPAVDPGSKAEEERLIVPAPVPAVKPPPAVKSVPGSQPQAPRN